MRPFAFRRSLFISSLALVLSVPASGADGGQSRNSLILEAGERSEGSGLTMIFSKPGRYHSYECPMFLVSSSSDSDAVCLALGKTRALSIFSRADWNWSPRCSEPVRSLLIAAGGKVTGVTRDLGNSEYIDSITCE